MRLYRFISKEELETLNENGIIIANEKANRFGDCNTAKSEENGIFFSKKRENGYHDFMLFCEGRNFLIEIEISDNDSRIVEECLGIYDDTENFDYDLNDPHRPQICLPEVIVRDYNAKDVVNYVNMLDVEIERYECGFMRIKKEA